MTTRQPMWAPIGTTIVSWQWVGVPDKYAPPRYFATHEEAERYADKTSGRVEIEYTLRAPDGTTWPLRMWLPERHRGDAAVGSVVTARRYRVGNSFEGEPTYPTPEGARDAVERNALRGTIWELLTFRTPADEQFEVNGQWGH